MNPSLDLEFAGNAHYERSCHGKLQCQTEKEAKRAARRMHKIWHKKYESYRCRYCGLWHCGTKKKRVNQIASGGDNRVAGENLSSGPRPAASISGPPGRPIEEGY